MGRKNRARSDLPRSSRSYPELRAYHPIIDGVELDHFFGQLQRGLPRVVDSRIEADRRGNERVVPQFRLHTDPDRSGLTILERRLTRRHAKKNRIQWNPNDVGRVTSEIEDEIGRLGLADHTITVEFTSVARLGSYDIGEQKDKTKNDGRKLGLLPDARSSASEFFVREHEISMGALTRNLRQFRYPYSTFIPHFTFGKVFKGVPEEQIEDAIGMVEDLLPLSVDVEPIRFSATQEVDTTSNK